jgi:hypothetical protein
VAESYALAANPDRAIAYLQQSASLREPTLLMLRYDPMFDSVRADPRLIELERKLGLPD